MKSVGFSSSSPEWFLLDATGHRAGPYTLDQLRGGLQRNELSGGQPVTAAHLGDRSIPLHTAVETEETGKPFRAPERPTKLLEIAAMRAGEAVHEETDPALNLFDALQAAKDKKERVRDAVRKSRAIVDGPALSPPPGSLNILGYQIPSQAWLVGSLSFALCALTWGIAQLASQPAVQKMANSDGMATSVQTRSAPPAPAPAPAPASRARFAATASRPATIIQPSYSNNRVPANAGRFSRIDPPAPPAMVAPSRTLIRPRVADRPYRGTRDFTDVRDARDDRDAREMQEERERQEARDAEERDRREHALENASRDPAARESDFDYQPDQLPANGGVMPAGSAALRQ